MLNTKKITLNGNKARGIEGDGKIKVLQWFRNEEE